MADNITLNAGTLGEELATAEVTFSGDTANVQVIGLGLITGTAESYAVQLAAGGTGVMGDTVQRVTLATDDPAVVDLAAIEVLITAGNVDLAAIEVLLTAANVDHAANEVLLGTIAGDTTNLDSKQPSLGTAAMAASIPVTLASDDTLTAAANALLTTIDTDTSAMVVDLAAIEVLLTAANVDHAANEVLLTTIAGDTTNLDGKQPALGTAAMAASIPVTLATDDTLTAAANALLTTIDTDTGAMVTDLAAIEVLITAGNVDLAAIEVLLTSANNTVAVLGTATYSEASTSGNVVGVVRNDELATLADTDNEIAPLQVDEDGALMVSETSVACKRASGVAASGTTAIITAVAGKKFRIHAVALFATSATVTNVYLATTTDTDVLGNAGNPIPLATDADGDNSAGFVMPWNPGGWTETSTANEALNLILSAAQDVIWAITYSEVS